MKIFKYNDFLKEGFITDELSIDLENDFQQCIDHCDTYTIEEDNIYFLFKYAFNNNISKAVEFSNNYNKFIQDLDFCLKRYDSKSFNFSSYQNPDNNDLIVSVQFTTSQSIWKTKNSIVINKSNLKEDLLFIELISKSINKIGFKYLNPTPGKSKYLIIDELSNLFKIDKKNIEVPVPDKGINYLWYYVTFDRQVTLI